MGEPPLTPIEQRRKLTEMRLRRGQLELELEQEERPRLKKMTETVASYGDNPPGDLVRQWKAYMALVHENETTLARYTVGISILLQAERLREATTDMVDVLRVLQSVRKQLPKDPAALVENFRQQTEAMQESMELMNEVTRDFSIQESATVAVERKTDPSQVLSAEDKRVLGLARPAKKIEHTAPVARTAAIDESAISQKLRRLGEPAH